jgi:hypothetical protein
MIGILARERLYGGRGGAMEDRQQGRLKMAEYAPGSPR